MGLLGVSFRRPIGKEAAKESRLYRPQLLYHRYSVQTITVRVVGLQKNPQQVLPYLLRA